jgi:hypothetical protein
LIEVIWSSGEEMWSVDAYQILYYSRGIEGEKRTHPRFADCILHSSIIKNTCKWMNHTISSKYKLQC